MGRLTLGRLTSGMALLLEPTGASGPTMLALLPVTRLSKRAVRSRSRGTACHSRFAARPNCWPERHPTRGEAALHVHDEVCALAAATGGGASAAVALSRTLGAQAPLPGHGATAERWSLLAGLGAGDLSAAKIAEAHLDALAIRAEAGCAPDGGDQVWAVYAAEAPGRRLTATESRGGWTLDGHKPWCSAAELVDRALVTAHTPGGRRLFAIDLRHPGVAAGSGPWVSRGLSGVTSSALTLEAVPGQPVGDAGWYLDPARVRLGRHGRGRLLVRRGGRRRATAVGRGPGPGAGPGGAAAPGHRRPAPRTRPGRCWRRPPSTSTPAGPTGRPERCWRSGCAAIVAEAADVVLAAAAHGLGPGPLATEEDHARRVADLQIFVRQHHAERDVARLGRLLLDRGELPW